MKTFTIIARLVLGAGFVLFGSNILVPFLPMPLPPDGSLARTFFGVMGPTYWMKLVGTFQVAGGVLVLAGGTAPLGLALLAPIVVNILAFHVFLTKGEGLAPGLVFAAVWCFLLYAYRKHFSGLLTTRARAEK